MKLIDTHAHLEQIKDLKDALYRAKSIGIVAIVAVGMDYKSNLKVLELSELYDGFVYPALGMHPWAIDGDVVEVVDLIECEMGRCVAVGEIGLDYLIKKDKDLQREVFEKMLKIAAFHGKPAIVHSRGDGSFEEALQMVRKYGPKRVVFHWYSGPVEVLEEILSGGYFVSATPSIASREEHREAIEATPVGRLLLETDSPAKNFEPADVRKALEFIAALNEIEESTHAEITTKNAIEFFGIEPG
ncbi:MAG: TatD family hydrolase [Halobacteriota archaeon]|nr:TatD family hydrolase [Halobacteriota archaeon]